MIDIELHVLKSNIENASSSEEIYTILKSWAKKEGYSKFDPLSPDLKMWPADFNVEKWNGNTDYKITSSENIDDAFVSARNIIPLNVSWPTELPREEVFEKIGEALMNQAGHSWVFKEYKMMEVNLVNIPIRISTIGKKVIHYDKWIRKQ